MSANYDVVFKTTIPVELQGRVYACRNTMQFFTIPIGMFWGGFMVDNVFEPLMSKYGDLPLLAALFGTGKGSGAAVMMFIIGISGVLICLIEEWLIALLKKINKRERQFTIFLTVTIFIFS